GVGAWEGGRGRPAVGDLVATRRAPAEGERAEAQGQEGEEGEGTGGTHSLHAGRSVRGIDQEQRLAVLDRVSVLDEDLHDPTARFRLDLVHQLHRFDDAEDLAFLGDVPRVET